MQLVAQQVVDLLESTYMSRPCSIPLAPACRSLSLQGGGFFSSFACAALEKPTASLGNMWLSHLLLLKEKRLHTPLPICKTELRYAFLNG